MTIKFVNTTTRLPMDTKLEADVRYVVKPILDEFTGSWQRRYDYALSICMVDPAGLDEHRRIAAGLEPGEWDAREPDRLATDQMPDTDLLGVFVPHDRATHQPIIAMSPEKILKASATLCNLSEPRWKLSTSYPAMLGAVAAHELAHAIMVPDLHPHDCGQMPWSYLADLFDDSSNDEWLRSFFDSLTSGFDVSSLHKTGNKNRFCGWKKDDRFPLLRPDDHLVIEESIANAIALRQRFDAEQRQMIRCFVAKQSDKYRAGLKWRGRFKDMIKVADSYACYKSDRLLWPLNRWLFDLCRDSPLPASVLAKKLMHNPSRSCTVGRSVADVGPVDFESEFLSYLRVCHPKWLVVLDGLQAGTDRHRNLGSLLSDIGSRLQPPPA